MFENEMKLAQSRLRLQSAALASTEVALQNAVKANLQFAVKTLSAKKVRQAKALEDTKALIAEFESAGKARKG